MVKKLISSTETLNKWLLQFHQCNFLKKSATVSPPFCKKQHEFNNLFGEKITTSNVSNTETLICRKKSSVSKNAVDKNSIY